MKKILFLFILSAILFLPATFLFQAPSINSPISLNIASASGCNSDGECGPGESCQVAPGSGGNKQCISSSGGGGGLVPCDTNCGIKDFFTMLGKIYTFVVIDIASPLAILAIIIGSIFILVSAGNPGRMGVGKSIVFAAIIGLALVLCSWVIVNFIMTTLGYTATWNVL